MITYISHFAHVALLFTFFFAFAPDGHSQTMDRIERGRMKDMLRIVKNEVKKNYYDPEFHGIDFEDRFKAAEEKLNAATTSSQSLAIIAQVLIDFNDSHLYFIPPSTNLVVEYGWRSRAIGDKVMVTLVKPGSDAEAKGLKPGDQILSVSGFRPTRKELWKVLYFYNAISRRDGLNLTVLSPGAEAPRELVIKSQMKTQPRSIGFTSYFRLFDDFYDEENDKHRFVTLGPVTVWKMPSFAFEPPQADDLVGSRVKGTALVLDLRGNGGGYVKTMEVLTSNFFDKELKVAELKGRKKMDPIIAKDRGKARFSGKLIVLLDSASGSASEIFARVIQLEKRGTVLGDVSSGSVMQSKNYEGDVGSGNSIVPFAMSITNADVIMSDGKSLEHTGVIPDELMLPSGEDLAAGRDPVMARAVELAGGKISPEEAGKLFKYYWKKD